MLFQKQNKDRKAAVTVIRQNISYCRSKSKHEVTYFTQLHIRGGIHIIFFLFLHENIRCGYSLEAPRWGASSEYPQHMFSWRNMEDISIFQMKKAPYLLLWLYTEGIAPDWGTCFRKIVFLFLMKTYFVGTHQKRLSEALLMSTYNICFCGEIRKISELFGENVPNLGLWIGYV